jgi:hypothetical protein
MLGRNSVVGFEVLAAVVMKTSILWDIMLCSLLKVNRPFGGICRLHLQGRRISSACFLLISFLAYSSVLKMEAARSSETSVDFQ